MAFGCIAWVVGGLLDCYRTVANVDLKRRERERSEGAMGAMPANKLAGGALALG